VEAPRPTADMATHAEGRAQVLDRLVWEQLRPSRRSMWSRRKEIQVARIRPKTDVVGYSRIHGYLRILIDKKKKDLSADLSFKNKRN
jgi:hypothetical protein